MERLAVDILGELPETEQGSRYILVIADYFTKWTECFPMRNMETTTIAKILVEEVITRFGIPRTIHSDQGSQFESKLFQEVCQLLNITRTRMTPYHPQSDGMLERFNRTLTDVLMAYRSAEHETTGMTPNKLMLGREVSTPLDLIFPVPSGIRTIPMHKWAWEMQEKMAEAHTFVRENTGKNMCRQKQVHDRRTSYEKFDIGDKVYVYFPIKKPGTSSKFTSFWRGPYNITGKLSDVLYRIDCGRNRSDHIIHCDRIRKCYSQTLTGETDGSKPDVKDDANGGINEFIPEKNYQENETNKRRHKPPIWLHDYVFCFQVKMPNTKQTTRKHPWLPLVSKMQEGNSHFNERRGTHTEMQ